WVALPVIVLAGGALLYWQFPAPKASPISVALPSEALQEASSEQVHNFCGTACHAYPPADTFPRSAWRREVKQAYDFFRDSRLRFEFPSQESVAVYYENRAPESLPLLKNENSTRALPVRLERRDYRIPKESLPAAVSNVNLVHLFDKRRLDV